MPVSPDPLCEESSLSSLDSLITSVERFYVRNHFSKIPELSTSTWRLLVDGEVEEPLTLSLADLDALPSKEQVATLECAGNSRSYVTPPAEGLAFRHGAVGTARWKGVPLALVLDKAGIKATAQEVVFEGADYGQEEEDGVAFDLKYTRSLPISKALHPDTLLAYQMNGNALDGEDTRLNHLTVPWIGENGFYPQDAQRLPVYLVLYPFLYDDVASALEEAIEGSLTYPDVYQPFHGSHPVPPRDY